VPSTQNVTILFTDLVNSTKLASALAPEAADKLRREHFSSLRRAIASSGGTEVKNLGDGLMVAFSTASEALSCAVGMQQAVELDNREAERALGVRVGLSGGEVTREGDDYFGDPVIEAARLCARADGAQILASDLVRATAGRRSGREFRPVGALELKGLPQSVETVEVGWEPMGEPDVAPDMVALPSRLSYRPLTGVIGRESEAASLADAFKRVAAGQGREVVLVSGEAGLGKTTLAADAARAALGAGAYVLLGRCDEDLSVPYGPFVEALSHYVTNVPEELLRSHVEAHGAELARLVPALAKRLTDLPALQSSNPDVERYLLFGAVVGLLTEASVSQPVLIVLDDLQWADKPSLHLLRHVVTSAEPLRLLVIGTYRDSELSHSHPLTETLAALGREPRVNRIELRGLDDTGVIAFMEAAAGHTLDDAGVGLAHALYRETDGNPFFVAEVLRHLSETGAVYQDETGRWMTSSELERMALPSSVRAVVGARVARLGEQAERALSHAAVIGRDFDLELLARASDCGEDDLLDILDGAASSALVQEHADVPGRYSFSHALVQHTLYQDLGATRRARAHRQVARALEDICGDHPAARVGELAHHWLSATQPVDATKAISYAYQAGEAALASLAPEDAVGYFSQAVELASHTANLEPSLRIDLLLGLGTAQRQAGIPAFRETLLDAAHQARRARDVGRLAMAALANSRGFFSALGQVDTEKVEVLEAALDALPTTDTSDRARLMTTLCSELIYHSPLERRLALADEAKAIARRLGDAQTLVDVIYRCASSIAHPSTLEAQLADTAEANAEDVDEASRLSSESNYDYILAVRAAQFGLASEHLARAKQRAEKLRQPQLVWMATYTAAAHALLLGDAPTAELLATEALDVGTASGQPDALSFYGVQLMVVRYIQGRLGELVPLITDAAEQNPAIPTFKAVLAVAHLDAGDATSARELFNEGAAGSFCLPDDVGWLDGIVRYARVAIELQLHDHAGTLLELLGPFHDQLPYNGLTPSEPAAMYLGGLAAVLGRYEDGERYFAEAAELCTRGGMRFAEADTRRLWGRMLATRGLPGDRERARRLLKEARASAETNGYAMIERRAAAALSILS
jgi:class 3 adenylate cyclase